jgi:aspartyl-tRNA(Asn)/glutamyl-tRNA(Gln) amidotransferase subunit A
MPNDLPFHSLTNLRAHLRRGDVTSVEIVEACLERIAALDGKLHAFVEVYRESALLAAQAADLQRQSGLPTAALHGLPIALKDLLEWKGRQTTALAPTTLGHKGPREEESAAPRTPR